jgi:hypothetical protein
VSTKEKYPRCACHPPEQTNSSAGYKYKQVMTWQPALSPRRPPTAGLTPCPLCPLAIHRIPSPFFSYTLRLTALLRTLAAVSTALAALLAHEATAQRSQTRAQAPTVLLLALLRRGLLVLHLLALWRIVHLLALGRATILLLLGIAALGRAVARGVSVGVLETAKRA